MSSIRSGSSQEEWGVATYRGLKAYKETYKHNRDTHTGRENYNITVHLERKNCKYECGVHFW